MVQVSSCPFIIGLFLAFLPMILQIADKIDALETIIQGEASVRKLSKGVLLLSGATLDKCTKACLEETEIKCHYFKYVNASRTCYLSETAHPMLDWGQGDAGRADGTGSTDDNNKANAHPEEKSLFKEGAEDVEAREEKVESLENRFSKLLQQASSSQKSRETDMETVKESQARTEADVAHLKRRLQDMTAREGMIQEQIAQIHAEQRKEKTNMVMLKRGQTHLDTQLSKLQERYEALGTGVRRLNTDSDAVKKRLGEISEDMIKLDQRLQNLLNDRAAGAAVTSGGLERLAEGEQQLETKSESLREHQRTLARGLTGLERQLKATREHLARADGRDVQLNQKIHKIDEGMRLLTESIERLRIRKGVGMEVSTVQMEAMEKRLMRAASQLTRIQAMLDRFNSTLGQLQGSRESQGDWLNDLNKRIESLTGSLKHLATDQVSWADWQKMTANQQRSLNVIMAMRDEQKTLKHSVVEHEGSIDSLRSAVDTTSSTTGNVDTRMAVVNGTVGQLRKEIMELRSTLNTLKLQSATNDAIDSLRKTQTASDSRMLGVLSEQVKIRNALEDYRKTIADLKVGQSVAELKVEKAEVNAATVSAESQKASEAMNKAVAAAAASTQSRQDIKSMGNIQESATAREAAEAAAQVEAAVNAAEKASREASEESEASERAAEETIEAAEENAALQEVVKQSELEEKKADEKDKEAAENERIENEVKAIEKTSREEELANANAVASEIANNRAKLAEKKAQISERVAEKERADAKQEMAEHQKKELEQKAVAELDNGEVGKTVTSSPDLDDETTSKLKNHDKPKKPPQPKKPIKLHVPVLPTAYVIPDKYKHLPTTWGSKNRKIQWNWSPRPRRHHG